MPWCKGSYTNLQAIYHYNDDPKVFNRNIRIVSLSLQGLPYLNFHSSPLSSSWFDSGTTTNTFTWSSWQISFLNYYSSVFCLFLLLQQTNVSSKNDLTTELSPICHCVYKWIAGMKYITFCKFIWNFNSEDWKKSRVCSINFYFNFSYMSYEVLCHGCLI
jgi:hypothetical protein